MFHRVENRKGGHRKEDVRGGRHGREGEGDKTTVERVSKVSFSAGEPFGDGAALPEEAKGAGFWQATRAQSLITYISAPSQSSPSTGQLKTAETICTSCS